MLRKLWEAFLWVVIIAGFPILVWAGYTLTSETYFLSRYGVEKEASVIALDHSNRTKGGTTFFYVLEIDGVQVIEDFRTQLPVGNRIAVLTIPDRPNVVGLGHNDSSMFEIFAGLVGGEIMALLVLTMFAFMAFATPLTLWTMWKVRHELLRA